MEIRVDIPDELATQAHARGVPVKEYIEELLAQRVTAASPRRQTRTPEQIRSWVKPGEWNQVEIIADGHLLVHLINGHMMSMTIDNDSRHFSPKGLIGLEIEGPGVLKISHRNIWLKGLH